MAAVTVSLSLAEKATSFSHCCRVDSDAALDFRDEAVNFGRGQAVACDRVDDVRTDDRGGTAVQLQEVDCGSGAERRDGVSGVSPTGLPDERVELRLKSNWTGPSDGYVLPLAFEFASERCRRRRVGLREERRALNARLGDCPSENVKTAASPFPSMIRRLTASSSPETCSIFTNPS